MLNKIIFDCKIKKGILECSYSILNILTTNFPDKIYSQFITIYRRQSVSHYVLQF